jgi:predicted nucleic acid-binding protein
LTIDSSVFVAALREQEPHHERSKALLEKVHKGRYTALEPYTVLVEIVAAVRRRTGQEELAHRVMNDLLQLNSLFFVELDDERAREAAEIAEKTGIRGMDAVVAQVAVEFQAPLITLDDEMSRRLRDVVEMKAPEEV